MASLLDQHIVDSQWKQVTKRISKNKITQILQDDFLNIICLLTFQLINLPNYIAKLEVE